MIPPEHLEVHVWPERGGGQQVGVSTGIRMIHPPTGIEVIVNVGRSQHENRGVAMHAIEGAITSPYYRERLP